MTAVVLPTHGRWAWDARGDGRAVRVSTHAESGLLNLSLWRNDVCVGTARLRPEDVAALVSGLTEGLAELADSARSAAATPERMHELELRLARLEHDLTTPVRRPRLPELTGAVTAVRRWVTRAVLRSGH